MRAWIHGQAEAGHPRNQGRVCVPGAVLQSGSRSTGCERSNWPITSPVRTGSDRWRQTARLQPGPRCIPPCPHAGPRRYFRGHDARPRGRLDLPPVRDLGAHLRDLLLWLVLRRTAGPHRPARRTALHGVTCDGLPRPAGDPMRLTPRGRALVQFVVGPVVLDAGSGGVPGAGRRISRVPRPRVLPSPVRRVNSTPGQVMCSTFPVRVERTPQIESLK